MKDVRTAGQRKRVFIRTYGCQMNVYDSDRMADVLRPLGYALSDSPEQADLIVLNTCHIRERASEKVYSELGRLRDLKDERRRDGADLTIAVAGCVAQAEGEEIVRRQPAVDIVVGPQAYHRLPELLARAARKSAERHAGGRQPGAGVLDTEFPAESKFDHLPAPSEVRAGSAFLSIQEGCDKFCTFCVVPYTRGAEYSRPAEAILREAALGHPRVLRVPASIVRFNRLGSDGLEFDLFAFVSRLEDRLVVGNELNRAILEKFREAEINIPFRTVDVHLRGIEALVEAIRSATAMSSAGENKTREIGDGTPPPKI